MCAVYRREYKRQEKRVSVVGSDPVLNFRFLSGSVMCSFPGMGQLCCQLKLRSISEGGTKYGEGLQVWATCFVVLPAQPGWRSGEQLTLT